MRIRIDIFLNRVIQALLLFLFVINLSEGLFAPFFAVFVAQSIAGASLKTVGFAIAISAIVKSILQVPLARKIDKKTGERDDFYVMFLGSLIVVAYTVGLIFVKFPWQLYLLSVLGGIGGACLMAAYYAVFARHTDKGAEGVEWSIFSVFGLTVSVALGGAIGGVLMDALGFKTVLWAMALLDFLATLSLLYLYPLLNKKQKGAAIEIKS